MLDPVSLAQTADYFGWVPIPLKDKRPTINGWERTTKENGVKLVTQEAQKGRANNVGILAGAPSGVVIVDIEATGLPLWTQFVGDQKIPETFIVQTGRKGVHYYFKYDDKTRGFHSGIIKINGIRVGDFLSNGRQAVFPGSTTESQYVVLAGYRGRAQDEIPKPIIAEMPDFIRQLVAQSQ